MSTKKIRFWCTSFRLTFLAISGILWVEIKHEVRFVMGCWTAPYKTKDAEAIRKLLMEPLSPEGAENKIYHLIGDDDLGDSLSEAYEKGDKDVRSIVLNFLQTWFGDNGDDHDVTEDWGFSEDFDDGALDIFKEMLTDWNQNQRFPTDKASNGATVMTPRQLANYLREHIDDLATRQSRRSRKILPNTRPVFPITSTTNNHIPFTFT